MIVKLWGGCAHGRVVSIEASSYVMEAVKPMKIDPFAASNEPTFSVNRNIERYQHKGRFYRYRDGRTIKILDVVKDKT